MFPRILIVLALTGCASKAPQDFEICLESKGCGEGILVLYRFTIHGDGRVVYFGMRGVKLLGRQDGRIDASKARELWLEGQKLHLLDLRGAYSPKGWSDLPCFELAVRGGERSNSTDFAWVDPAEGWKPSSPEEETCAQLNAFGRELEAAVDLSHWIGTQEEIDANRFWLERDRAAGR
jgi:hypothetical protein